MLQEKECKSNGIQYIKKHLSLESLNLNTIQQPYFVSCSTMVDFLGLFQRCPFPIHGHIRWSLLRSSFPGEDDAFHVAICLEALPKLLDAGQGFGGMELLSLLLLPLPQNAGTSGTLGHDIWTWWKRRKALRTVIAGVGGRRLIVHLKTWGESHG